MSSTPTWHQRLARYAAPDTGKSLRNLGLTLVCLVATVGVSRVLLAYSWLLTVPFSVVAGMFLVRLFIVQHDCGHHSFLRNKAACDWIGRCLSMLTLTPYGYWRRDHDKHHATSGNLDHRGIGDITTLTVSEYVSRSYAKRFLYRIYRSPLVLFGFGPAWQFLLRNRLPIGLHGRTAEKSRRSIILTNLALAGFFGIIGWFSGFSTLAIIWLPPVVIAATVGVWLFFVQHAFERTYWERGDKWNFVDAALRGCSYYRLPGWMHWLTGWIGLHHIHHLAPRVPFYNLKAAMAEVPGLQDAPALGLLESLGCIKLALWCERRKRLVSFREAYA